MTYAKAALIGLVLGVFEWGVITLIMKRNSEIFDSTTKRSFFELIKILSSSRPIDAFLLVAMYVAFVIQIIWVDSFGPRWMKIWGIS